MAKNKTATPTEAHPILGELDAIHDELLRRVAHFRLADQRLWGDLAGLPEEYQPAATVLHDATDALDVLCGRLDTLNGKLADLRHGPGWRDRLREWAPEAVQ